MKELECHNQVLGQIPQVIHRDSSKAMGKEVVGMMYKPSVFCHDASHSSTTCPKDVLNRQSMETGRLVGGH